MIISEFLVGFQVLSNISFFVSDFKGATILSCHNQLVIPGTLQMKQPVSSSYRIWISCFLFSTEDRITFWAGNFVVRSRWCFLVSLSLFHLVLRTKRYTHDICRRWDRRHCLSGMKLSFSWHSRRNLLRHHPCTVQSRADRSIYVSDICITSIPPRDFYMEQPLDYVLWFTKPHSFLWEHCCWDRCKLIGEDILHINSSITLQQCNDSWVNGIQVIYFWVTNLDRFVWCFHGLDFLRDSAVEPFWPSLLKIFQHSLSINTEFSTLTNAGVIFSLTVLIMLLSGCCLGSRGSMHESSLVRRSSLSFLSASILALPSSLWCSWTLLDSISSSISSIWDSILQPMWRLSAHIFNVFCLNVMAMFPPYYVRTS